MIAFFDMDRTLLSANTGTLWPRYLYRRGELSRAMLVRSSWWVLLYQFALLDMDDVSRRLISGMRDEPEDELREKCRRWVMEEVLQYIRPRARARIETHRSAGETCAMLTSASPYASVPVALSCGLDDVVCTRLEVKEGRFTGRLVEPLCFGAGKVVWAERLAQARGARLSDCAFYTDSYTDMPMLERVGRPVVVCPDFRLRREARRRGWPIEDWNG